MLDCILRKGGKITDSRYYGLALVLVVTHEILDSLIGVDNECGSKEG